MSVLSRRRLLARGAVAMVGAAAAAACAPAAQPTPTTAPKPAEPAKLAAGTAPDAMLLLSYWGAVFGKRGGILLPLDDHLKSAQGFSRDAYDKTLLTYTEWNGKLHALPLNTNVQGIHYNKEHFEKAGIANVPKTAEQAWSWDQFLEV